MNVITRRLVAATALLLPLAASAYGSLVIFGDSLSDSGNNAIVLGTDPNQVVTSNAYVPTRPYASGTYSNGAVWATTFAADIGVSAQPSRAGGSNYAYGGATSGGVTIFPPSLVRQLGDYLATAPAPASVSDTLFVIAGGGNDARAALDRLADGAPPLLTIGLTASRYAANIGSMVDTLQVAGAQNIVVWDTPDVGLSPAAIAAGGGAAGTLVATQMNLALNQRLAGESGVTLFSVFGLVNDAVSHPGDYGFGNVSDACGAVLGCDPSSYLFWDGVHPTSAGHALLAEAMLAAVPEPAPALLLGVGAVVLLLRRRRQSAAISRSTSSASL